MNYYDSKNILARSSIDNIKTKDEFSSVLIDDLGYEFSDSKINLFIEYYEEKNTDRMAEYIECLKRNIENDYIDKIFLITEDSSVNANNKKIKIIKVNYRLTYENAFNIINDYSDKDDINVLSNSDIYFNYTLQELRFNKFTRNDVLCLTRWNVNKDSIIFHNRKDSQDVWIFFGKIRNVNENMNFNLGKPGCDNRIAAELTKLNYNLLNPSLTIKAFHLHQTKVRNYESKIGSVDRIPKPYCFIIPSQLRNRPIKTKDVILHLALNSKYQKSLTKALMSLGEYIMLDWKKTINKRGYVGFCDLLFNRLIEFKPNILFMQIQRPAIINRRMIERIISIVPNIKIINWCGDIRNETPEWMLEYIDIPNVYTSFTNMRDVNYFKQYTDRVFYMPMVFDEHTFNIKNKKIKMDIPDIVFIGNYYSIYPLAELRMNMVIELKRKYGDRFGLYGNERWNGFSPKKIKKEKTNFIYRNSKIAISVNNINAYKYTSDRLFNIMASGTFCLTHYFEGIEEFFENGFHLVWWKTIDELIQYIDYFLSHEKERKQIAINGYKEVWKNHKWSNRIKIIKERVLENG